MTVDKTTTTTNMTKKKAFIVDTDAGNFSDDFWALALQLCDPLIDIRFIVTSGYETKLKAKIVAKFLTNCGFTDIPIVRGVHTEECLYLLPDEDGLLQPQETFVEGAVNNPILRRWGQDFDLSNYKGKIYGIGENEDHGLDHLQDVLNATAATNGCEEHFTYVLQGSSENIGYLLDKDSTLFRRNSVRIVCMGGTYEKKHEYNFALDSVNTRRMLQASDDVTVVPIEPSYHARLHGIGHDDDDDDLDPKHNSYSIFLAGDSKISLAMAKLELTLANYGTHKEVADGETDIMFDIVAAYVASDRCQHLYIVKDVTATIDDKGRILVINEKDNKDQQDETCQEEKDKPIKFSMMTDWVSEEAADTFKYLVAKTIAAGTYIDQ